MTGLSCYHDNITCYHVIFFFLKTSHTTKRLLNKTSPLQNVSIQNVYTHNVYLTKRLLNETSPVTERLRNKMSPGLRCPTVISRRNNSF
jgi:hypothetical protein